MEPSITDSPNYGNVIDADKMQWSQIIPYSIIVMHTLLSLLSGNLTSFLFQFADTYINFITIHDRHETIQNLACQRLVAWLSNHHLQVGNTSLNQLSYSCSKSNLGTLQSS